jgi:hypothetical protein
LLKEANDMEGVTKPLKTATYLLRFTPDEKAALEQKVRRAAAAGQHPLSLAEALRMGVNSYLDELIEMYEGDGDAKGAGA